MDISILKVLLQILKSPESLILLAWLISEKIENWRNEKILQKLIEAHQTGDVTMSKLTLMVESMFHHNKGDN